MHKIYVDIEDIITESTTSEEPYGDWSATHDCHVVGVSHDPKRLSIHREEVEIAVDPTTIDGAFLVEVTYYDGDSFGASSGKLKVVAAFHDRNQAAQCAEDVRNAVGEYNRINYSLPWNDYFGGIEKVEVNSYSLI